MFDAILQFEDLLLNPIFIAFIVALIVDIGGYLENKVRNSSTGFDTGMMAETIIKYEVFIPLLSFAFQLEYAIVGAFIIDVLLRVVAKLKPTPA